MATTARAPINQPAPQAATTTAIAAQTQTDTQAILHLRGAPLNSERGSSRRRIQWAEDVVDNEGLGRKKSKVCCIYHAPKGIDQSSDESSSDSGSDSESGDDGTARPVGGKKGGQGDQCGHGHEHGQKGGKGAGEGSQRKRSPNAYERLPKVKDALKKEK
ncbi:related to Type 1 phosphatases regulator ypi-1 [Rhynchosporium agropyri]|uniref:Type 1 phosphatases regulator n=1 Tax=Rhynchosporium agropyri TaxID=914238 RepID=A0A1E1KXA2_9HELO|nr:related to Type 1 phosphatases regulator ypi-1 [Rhynchosporium agropyri]